ncbi:MAG: DUF502 domain-containing protein [Neomegalonema sp.]|nr:DUF502 domain-containing protein [Neomegalonema sp.]
MSKMGLDQNSGETDSGRGYARPSFLQQLRNNLLAGIVVVAPFGITVYLAWSLIELIDDLVLPQLKPLIPAGYWPDDSALPFYVPGVGLIVLLLSLIFIGSLAKNFFGRELIRIGEVWVERMPIIRSIYNALKQIAETIFSQSSASFERACLVEYPRKGLWAVAFVSTSTKGEIPAKAYDGREMMSVFLPTTPNPTSGFLLFVPKEDIIYLDMSVEEAAKLVISAGLITPPTVEERAAAAAAEAAKERQARQDRLLKDRNRRSAARPDDLSPGQAAEAAARSPLFPPKKK